MSDGTSRLALAVISQAISDLTAPVLTSRHTRRKVVDEARTFLFGDQPENRSALEDWCLLAGLHPDDLRRRVLKMQR